VLPAAAPAVPPVIGCQRPREAHVPEARDYSAGDDAIELCSSSGVTLDDWQSWALRQSMGQSHGYWSAFEVGILVARQNGKNQIVLARQLAGLFMLEQDLQIHTAHEFKASAEHFRRIARVIETNPDLDNQVQGIRTSHGAEAIELKRRPTIILGANGKLLRVSRQPRLNFLARSRGSGRAFTCDTLYYDEAMILTDEQVGASLPTLSAVANPQVWYTASAGYPDSTQLDRVRKRGLNHMDDSLLWLEWSIDACHDLCLPGCTQHDDPTDPQSWARANPGLGVRISVDFVRREMLKMPPKDFERERLGVGDWPVDEMGWNVIPQVVWDACAWRGE
jgi:phage terminase large subunit-like protein